MRNQPNPFKPLLPTPASKHFSSTSTLEETRPERAVNADGPGMRSQAVNSRPLLSLQSTDINVAPGQRTSLGLSVMNSGYIVDRYCLEVLGAASNWAEISPKEISLFPGQTADATITFSPLTERPPLAGEVPFAVKATPADDPANATVEEGTVSVGALPRMAAEMRPLTSNAYRRGRHRLWVNNDGNVDLPVTVRGDDPDGLLRFAIRPGDFVAQPGASRAIRLRVRAPRYSLIGSPRQHRFAVTVSAQGTPDVTIPASLRQRPLLTRTALAALALLAVLAVLGYFLGRPVIKSVAEASTPTPTTIAHQGAAAGPPGRPGSQGATGATGRQGVAGAKGATGARGATGAKAATGPAGPRGVPGAAGPQGVAGVAGAAGPQGTQGPAGPTGDPGPDGTTNGAQGTLTGGSLPIDGNPTLVVQTPELGAGRYVVAADVVAASDTDSREPDNTKMTCWIAADSTGISDNSDHVQASSYFSSSTLELAVDDIITTTSPNDRIDLACSDGNDDSAPIQGTDASITVTKAQAIETTPS